MALFLFTSIYTRLSDAKSLVYSGQTMILKDRRIRAVYWSLVGPRQKLVLVIYLPNQPDKQNPLRDR